MGDDGALVRVRLAKEPSKALSWSSLNEELIRSANPWRMVRHYHGQAHFPGWFWSERLGRRLMYESRLELDRLLLADFDPKLEDIREQPFQVTICLPDGTKARHIPDFFISRYGTLSVAMRKYPLVAN